MNTIGGECPILLRVAGSDEVVCINGNTAAPARATPGEFRRRGLEHVPDEDILAAGVPATFSALVTALRRYGTMPLREVIAPAIELARNGFAASQGLVGQEKYGLRYLQDKFARWPGSAAIYSPAPEVGALLRNEPLAKTYDYLANARDPLDAFYRGDVAAEIARFSKARDGLLDLADLGNFETRIEKPASLRFGEATVYKCGFWSQGPAMLQCLGILKRFDLKGMGFGSADYLHVLIEAMKLAFADREQYYGDPQLALVPAEVLLSEQYSGQRAGLIDLRKASGELAPGDAWRNAALLPADERFTPQPWGPGTVHVDAVDAKGNMASFTPSGAWLKSAEVIPALGFPLTTRLMTFYLGPSNHPNVVAPGKRPRTTLTPSLAFRGGKPWMSFGTMGGDQQEQWSIQFLLCREAFGMTLQEAIEAPKLSTDHFPGFFAPHDHFPRHVRIEARFGAKAIDELRRRGHEIDLAPDWTEGFISAAELHPDGRLEAGCDPRGSKSEAFPSFAYCW
jgi:gamma-glutamyltranspeptidase / glutathione hydrolase